MIKRIRTVQVHDSLYIRQRQRQNRCVEQTTRLQKKKTKHNILKINDDGFISANVQNLNATLRIFRDDQEQFSIIKRRLAISENKIDETIREYHDDHLECPSMMLAKVGSSSMIVFTFSSLGCSILSMTSYPY